MNTRALLRPGYQKRATRSGPSFTKKKFENTKQNMRLSIAQVFSQYLVGIATPRIFVLPYYYARCAATIESVLPRADFYGVDRIRRVAENVSSLPSGRTVKMKWMLVSRYVREMAEIIQFHAAYLDYTGKYSPQRAEEIVEFCTRMMMPMGVVALTLQHEDAKQVAREVIDSLAGKISSVTLVEATSYQSERPMAHVVLLLKKF